MENAVIIFYAIIGILILDYAFDQFLEYLNRKYRTLELPDRLKGIYNEKEYKRSQQYESDNQRLSFVSSTFNLIVIITFISLEGFAFVDQIARNITENSLLIPLIFFGILFLALDLINLPFSIYDTFVIEERHGFNKATPKIFITDKLKSYLLTAIIGGGLLILIVWFYQKTGDLFWIYALGIIIVFTVFMTMFYTHLIVPLFNKLNPLQEGPLKQAIVDFSRKVGFQLKNIFVINGSKRSTKANAFFSGLGKKKRIVLFDTLMDKLENNEIVAVLAHEIGHYKKKHTLVNLILSVVQTGITLYILSLVIDSPLLSKALGVERASFHIGLIAFSLLYNPISTVLGIGMKIISRKNEFAADEFAKNNFSGEFLIEALKKLSVNNLSNLTPHPLYVFVHYSHPTLLQRMEALGKTSQR
ncbi:MAG: M48 family metallopeptidase [Bacteroidota bacterium]